MWKHKLYCELTLKTKHFSVWSYIRQPKEVVALLIKVTLLKKKVNRWVYDNEMVILSTARTERKESELFSFCLCTNAFAEKTNYKTMC